jgi:hypothetical protein
MSVPYAGLNRRCSQRSWLFETHILNSERPELHLKKGDQPLRELKKSLKVLSIIALDLGENP